jgi:hypothetical protein
MFSVSMVFSVEPNLGHSREIFEMWKRIVLRDTDVVQVLVV